MAIHKPTYEAGMRISYDIRSLEVTVAFRGRIIMIGVSANEHDAVNAGESHCQRLGWRCDPMRTSGGRVLRNRWGGSI
jgi:hypothetical protein